MDVFDDEHEWPLSRARFEWLAHSPEDLLRRSRSKRGVELILGARGNEDLAQRPVGDALAVGQAAAGEHVRLAVQVSCNLEGEPRLADAGRAEHRDEPAAPSQNRLVESAPYSGELLAAADQRRIEPPLEGRRSFENAQQPVRSDRVGLPLERERLDRFHLERVAGELQRLRAEQDLVRGGRLLETGGDVDGIAGRKPLSGSGLAGRDLAGVDADTGFEANAEVALELRVQADQPLAHRRRGVQGAAHGPRAGWGRRRRP